MFLHVHFEHLITHYDLINLFIHLFSADLSRIQSLDIKKKEKKNVFKELNSRIYVQLVDSTSISNFIFKSVSGSSFG